MDIERKKWIKRRFGDVDEAILGYVKDLGEMGWVDLVKSYPVEGRTLTYRMVKEIEKSADRIAEIFRNGAYEMINNSEIDWHQQPEHIIEKVRTGEWKFYGCYLEGKLVAVESMYIIRGDRTMEWVWGCVDPVYRGLGVWQNIGLYTDQIVGMSGAQVGSVWVVTTHKYSQMAVEKAGYLPTGCFLGKRIYGGSDDRYYRATLIHYAKLYGTGRIHLQDWKSMKLTTKAAKVVNLVKELWMEGSQINPTLTHDK